MAEISYVLNLLATCFTQIIGSSAKRETFSNFGFFIMSITLNK